MELITFFFGLLGVGYVIWGLISPFVVIGLTTRVNQLEGQLDLLRKESQRALSRETPPAAVATAPPDKRTDWSSERVHNPLSTIAAANREASLSDTAAPIPAASALPPIPSPVLEPDPWVDPLVTHERQLAENKAQEFVHHASLEPDAVEPPPLPVPAIESGAASVVRVEKISKTAPVQGNRQQSATAIQSDRDEPSTLEEILAGKWLTWVGALAVIIGAGFGFKYAVENNWVGPRERVIIGILTGLACFAGGAYAIRRNYVFLAQGLTGAALGVLYLSLYAAFGWYGILSYEAAFMGMILTTTLGLSFAGYFNVQPTAVLGMLGGFLTPAMLWPDQDPMWTLFPYLLMLDLGVLLVAGVRRWAGLEILAFCGTLIIWLSWHRQFYLIENLPQTGGFMTAFLVLFALLSVWHNVVRKRKALAGDFFLIMATPTVYFTALYALTFEKLPHWQGEFALSMMLFYTVLAALAAVWHPAGKSVLAALAGLASTFLILSVPLELTGHWVAICWIAQAVLLVELGLYFREKTLAWTGLALLVKVQGILLIYFVGTLADPIHFQTAFVRLQLHLINRPETPIDTATSLMSLVNGRSLSYLADVVGFSILAWELGRRRKDSTLIESLLPQRSAFQLWLNVAVPVVALAMIVLETFAWGAVWHWDAATIVSGWMIWTALFACGLIVWSRLFLAAGIEKLGWILFALLACFVGFETIESLQVALAGTQIPPHRLEAWWLLNPRGIGCLMVILATGLVALIYGVFQPRETDAERPEKYTSRNLMELFGTCAYTLALGLVLLETRVWGAAHGWLPATTIGVCAVWTTVFLAGGVAWLLRKPQPWVEDILRGTFLLLQFWFLLNALGALGSLITPGVASTVTAYEWWSLDVRGMGCLASVMGSALAGWLLSRHPLIMSRSEDKVWPLPYWLGIGGYVMGLGMVLLETSLWGVHHGWLPTTVLSAAAIWTTVFVVGAALWRVVRRATWVDQLVLPTFCLLEMLLIVSTVGTLQFVNLTAVESPLAAVDWWMFNPRGLGFLVALIGCGFAAALSSDPSKVSQKKTPGWSLPQLLGVGAFLTGLIMVLLETAVWGAPRGWLIGTLIGSGVVWISVFTVGLVGWSVRRRTADYDGLVGLLYGGLLLLLVVLGVGGVDDMTARQGGTLRAFRTPVELWFLNPRFIGFLMSMAAAGISAWLYRGQHRMLKLLPGEQPGDPPRTLDASSLFGIAVYLMGVVMCTLEVHAQGTSRDWHTATSLAVTLVWTTYAMLTLIMGISWRSGWIRVFSLGLFVLTVGKVFLFDVWHLDTVIRVFAFISLGVALLLVSFLYRRFRDRIRSWMALGVMEH